MPHSRAQRSGLHGLICRVLFIGLFLPMAGVPAWAQAVNYEPSPSQGLPLGKGLLSTSLELSWQFTDNLFKRGEPLVSSSLTQIRPSIRFSLPYSNSILMLSYSPQFREYSRADLPTKVAHYGRLENMLRLSNGMEFNFSGELTRGVAETTEIDPASQITFSTTPFRHGRASLAWTWDHPSHWGTVLKLDRDDVKFLQTETIGSAPTFLPFFDYTRGGFSLDATWKTRPRLVFYGGGEFHNTDEDRRTFNSILIRNNLVAPGTTLPDSDLFRGESLHLGARGVFGRRTVGEVQAAYTQIRFQGGKGRDFSGLELNAKAEVLLTSANQISLEAVRQPISALSDTSSILLLNSVRLAWSFTPGPRQSWGASTTYQESDYQNAQGYTTLSAEGSWSFQVHRRARLQLSALRIARRTTFPGLGFNENRVTVGWLLGWF